MRKSYGPGIRTLMMLSLRRTLVLQEFYSALNSQHSGIFQFLCNMNNQTKLFTIKIIHTFIWVFFNVVIFYMLYAAIANKLDKWLWIGYALVILEGVTLLIFKFFCPLTIMARKYSDSTKDNFDIFLPGWLAKYTKLIYTSIMVVIVIITIFQLLK